MKSTQHAPRQRGIALLWTVITIFALIAIAGLAIDTLHVVHAGQQLQNSADAAALAGAHRVRKSIAEAREQAAALGLENTVHHEPVSLDLNDANESEGDIIIGRFDRSTRQFTPTLSGPNAVRIIARRDGDNPAGRLPLLFGPIFNVDAVDLEVSAVAMSGGGTGAGLIVLSEDDPDALEVGGNGNIYVEDGAVQVNSSHYEAARGVGNSATLHAPEVNIYGGERQLERILADDVQLNTHTEEALPDPLADLPDPYYDVNAPLPSPSSSETATLEPGYYPAGITLTSGDFHLEPGIYVLDGAGLDVNGGTFYADGVMFYIINDGVVNLGGNGQLTIRPPDPENPAHAFADAAVYEGISIFQARDNTNESNITGTNDMDLQGTLYFPNNRLVVRGTSDSLGNQLIAHTLSLLGTGDITIKYDGRFPAAGYRVFLVE